jgi:hypothetical protein
MTAQQQPPGTTPGTAGQESSLLRRIRSGDFVISTVLLVVFAATFLGAQDWPYDAKIFPILISSVGMALALLKMALSLRPPRTPATAGRRLGDVELTDEDDEEDEALEYIFETASRTDWVRVLSWAGGFFLVFFLIGAIPAILAFTVLYLLFEARTTLWIAVAYAAALGGLLYAAREILNILLPAGILFQ